MPELYLNFEVHWFPMLNSTFNTANSLILFFLPPHELVPSTFSEQVFCSKPSPHSIIYDSIVEVSRAL